MQTIFKNVDILKNDGHFRIPHPKISLKHLGGGKMIKDFRKTMKFKKY